MIRRAAWWGLLLLGGALGAQTLDPLPSVRVSPAPGAYAAPLSVALDIPPGVTARYRFLESSSTQAFPWAGTLTLDALPGETRTYTLRLTSDLASGETQTRDYRYTVRQAAPTLPSVRPTPGVYAAPIRVEADLPPGWGPVDPKLTLPLDLTAAPGGRRTLTLALQGPGGGRLEWTWTVDRRDQEETSLDILSPVPGDFADPQVLAVSFRGSDSVRWSWGDTYLPDDSREYRGPVALDRSGPQAVTVALRSRADGTWKTKTVRWSSGTASPPDSAWPASGALAADLVFPALTGAQWSWDEGRSWAEAAPGRLESVVPGAKKVLAVRVRKGGQTWRGFYWIDGRTPKAPDLTWVGGWNPQVVVSGEPETRYTAVWTLADGTSREESLGAWGPLAAWKVPDGVVAARVEGRGPGGLGSPAAAVTFGETGWSTPVWEPWDQDGPQTDRSALPLGGRVWPRDGFRAVYEVGDRPDVPEPRSDSPLLGAMLTPTVPPGADRTFYVRFAWRDAQGLVGPATRAVALRVDRVPPRAPEVVEAEGRYLLRPAEGEEEGPVLFWAVSDDRVTDASSLNFQAYTGPLDPATLGLAPGQRRWLHAQALDRSGNAGPARLNVALGGSPAAGSTGIFQVDPDPSVGEVPVADGGVYPWAEARLRASDADRSLWAAVADQAVPADWAARLQPWTGLVTRTVARGERRTFLVYWNSRTADGWAWAEPRTLRLTLDQGPPAHPVQTGAWPSKPLSSPWTLTLTPGQPGDRLVYTETTDGSVPADPLTLGRPWPGSVTWEPRAEGSTTVRVRVAALSMAGLGFEVPLGASVVLDRTPPAPLLVPLSPFTFGPGPFAVPAFAYPGLVRYTLTSDGTLPPVPGDDAPVLPADGFYLAGAQGKSILYRLRFRPYSEAGVAGSVGDAFAILVDRTATAASSLSPDPEASVQAPDIDGLPDRGISASPVVLTPHWGQGILRMELREGLGPARAVTDRSAAWTTPLVLDAGEGNDRSWAVAVRGFTPEGQPLTPETVYRVRVDRSAPSAPVLALDPAADRPAARLRLVEPVPSADEVLQWRWTWDSFPEGRGESAWQVWTAEGQAPTFEAPARSLTRLKLEAYYRDEAGNEGPHAAGTLLLDQEAVYLAPGGQGTGGRTDPVGTVEAAWARVAQGGKSVVLAAAGTYTVTKTLDLGGLAVFGGLSSADWDLTAAPTRSAWTAAAGFTGTSLVSARADWSLSRVDLASGLAVLERLVSAEGGRGSVKASTWTAAQTQTVWAQTGGSLAWTDVSVSYAAKARGTLAQWKDVDAVVQGLVVTAVQNQGGVLFSTKGGSTRVQDLSLVSKKASGYDAVWSAAGGSLTVTSARILDGDGAARAAGFLLDGVQASFTGLELALYGQGANTGLQGRGGKWTLADSKVSLLAGTEFNQGLNLEAGDVKASNLALRVTTGSWQGAMTLRDSRLEASGLGADLAGGGQRAWGIQFLGVCTVVLEDTSWSLGAPTPGQAWLLEKPWAPGSSENKTAVTGW